MTIKVGGKGKGMIMPMTTIFEEALHIVNGGSTTDSSTALFYTRMEDNHDNGFYDAATLQPVANQLEQTIVDTGTGQAGVLTQVVSGKTASNDMVVRVYIDGKTHTFTYDALSSTSMLCLGDFAPWEPTITPSTSVGIGSVADFGWVTVSASRGFTMLSPEQSAQKGLPIGMVFEDSLKVTIQAVGGNMTVGSTTSKALAAWLTYIPKGTL